MEEAEMNMREQIEEFLKTGWRSNFEMQQWVKSSGADSTARKIRQNPPEGYVMEQRPRNIEGYRKCLEFKLVRIGQQALF